MASFSRQFDLANRTNWPNRNYLYAVFAQKTGKSANFAPEN